MPADPHIRAALDAAARTLCFGPDGADCDRCIDPVHCTGSSWMRPGCAAAIAAFNAALVSHFHSVGMGDLALDLESIAEAVEAAARDE
jgi:hypothetical protein